MVLILLIGALIGFGAAPAAAQEPVDVSRLPVDLQKIQRELRQQPPDLEERDGLNLRYTVEVFGEAPPLVVIEPGEDLVHGPVPNSAPTHREMIEHVTPREFRAPVADFTELLRWLAEWAASRDATR